MSTDNTSTTTSGENTATDQKQPKKGMKTWVKVTIGLFVALLLFLGLLIKSLMGGSMPSHLQYVSKDALSVTVVNSLSTLPESLQKLGVFDSSGKPSALLDAKPPKEGDINPASLGFWLDSRFSPLQPIVISHHLVDEQMVHVFHLPTISPQVSADYVAEQLTQRVDEVSIENTIENGKTLSIVTGGDDFPFASMALLVEDEKLLLALSPKMNSTVLNSQARLFLVEDLAQSEALALAKSNARKARVKKARDALKKIKEPLKEANQKQPDYIAAKAARDASYTLPNSDPKKNEKIDAAEDAWYTIQDKYIAEIDANPKVKEAKAAVAAARIEEPAAVRVQGKTASQDVLKSIAAGVSKITAEASFEGMLTKLEQPFVLLNHLNVNSTGMATFEKNMSHSTKSYPGLHVIKNLTDAMRNINTRVLVGDKGLEVDGEWEFDEGNYIMKQVANGGADTFAPKVKGQPLVNLKAALNVEQIIKDLPEGVLSEDLGSDFGVSVEKDILNYLGAPMNIGVFYDEKGVESPLFLNAGIWIKLKEGHDLQKILGELTQKAEMGFEPKTVENVEWHVMSMDFDMAVGVVDNHLAIMVGSKIINDVQTQQGEGFLTHYGPTSKSSIEKDAAYALNANPKMINRLITEKPGKHNGSKEYVALQKAQEEVLGAFFSVFDTISLTMPKAGYGLNFHFRAQSEGNMNSKMVTALQPKLKTLREARKAYKENP